MSDSTNQRKFEHIEIITDDQQIDRRKYYFDDIRLTHRALPEIDLADVDPAVDFLGKRLSFPLVISSMTGGDCGAAHRCCHGCGVAARHVHHSVGPRKF